MWGRWTKEREKERHGDKERKIQSGIKGRKTGEEREGENYRNKRVGDRQEKEKGTNGWNTNKVKREGRKTGEKDGGGEGENQGERKV